MKETQYPSTDCNVEGHQKVLVAIGLVLEHYSAERIQVGAVHRLAKTMINWFPDHINFLDSAVSAWVSKQRFAGMPVVLCRNVLVEVWSASKFDHFSRGENVEDSRAASS